MIRTIQFQTDTTLSWVSRTETQQRSYPKGRELECDVRPYGPHKLELSAAGEYKALVDRNNVTCR